MSDVEPQPLYDETSGAHVGWFVEATDGAIVGLDLDGAIVGAVDPSTGDLLDPAGYEWDGGEADEAEGYEADDYSAFDQRLEALEQRPEPYPVFLEPQLDEDPVALMGEARRDVMAELLEALIASLHGRERAIALLGGHLGLRPVELRLALWGDLGDGTLTIGRARTKKTAARTRVIAVPAATLLDLKHWRMESGRPADTEPIIGPMTSYNLKAFGTRKLRPAKALTGRDDVTVYTLRHTHASALHYAGWTVPAAARRLGHGPALHVTHYAHVIDALEGQPHYGDLDALFTAARADVPRAFPALGSERQDLAL